MKTRRPFFALVQLELSRSATIFGNPIAWLLVVVLLAENVAPAFLLRFQPDHQFYLVVLEMWVFMMVAWWLVVLIMECSSSLAHGLWGVLEPLGVPAAAAWQEFLSSRAIDRELLFRAKTLTLLAFLSLPLLLNLALVGVMARQFPPDLASFGNAAPDDLPSVAPVVIATAFGGAMLWVSVAAIVVMQAYYGLVTQWFVERGTVRAALVACGPIFVVSFVCIVFRLSFDPETSRIAPLVQFFARHWLALTLALVALALPAQRMCERRFAEQEVL